MSKQISSMWVGLTGNVSGLSGAFKAAIGPIRGVQSAVSGAGSAIGGAFGTAMKFTGIGAGIGAAFAAIKGAASGITLASDLEQTGVALETMLGSAGRAKALMGQLTGFAAE